jgi:hypothetical protein
MGRGGGRLQTTYAQWFSNDVLLDFGMDKGLPSILWCRTRQVKRTPTLIGSPCQNLAFV